VIAETYEKALAELENY